MPPITQYSRISHHTITTGATFSVPPQEDFTAVGASAWTPNDLALSEIGVDELNNKAFIRIGSVINEFSFGGATFSSFQTISYSSLLTAIGSSSLVPGMTYLVTGRSSGVTPPAEEYEFDSMIIQAITTTELNSYCLRIAYVPAQYTAGTDGNGNVWLGIWNSSLSPSIGELCIWGGAVWSNDNGNVGTAIDDVTLDSEWTLVGRTSFSNNEYLQKQLFCSWDYVNNYILSCQDEELNFVKGAPAHPDPTSFTDWGIAGAIPFYANYAPEGIYNNRATDISNNTVERYITNNDASGGVIRGNTGVRLISGNIVALDITGNSNKGSIENNNCQFITGNSNDGDILNNNITGYIADNSVNGYIQNNTCSGNISNNNCNGNIFSNSNTSNIEFNSNTGSIQNNTSGISSISKNANNGSISGNTSGSSFSIQNNINNGNIGPGTLVANIVDPIVNK